MWQLTYSTSTLKPAPYCFKPLAYYRHVMASERRGAADATSVLPLGDRSVALLRYFGQHNGRCLMLLSVYTSFPK